MGGEFEQILKFLKQFQFEDDFFIPFFGGKLFSVQKCTESNFIISCVNKDKDFGLITNLQLVIMKESINDKIIKEKNKVKIMITSGDYGELFLAELLNQLVGVKTQTVRILK